jgi:excinuclease ABC subunit C
MGQCLGVCTGEISPAEYRKKVIRPLVTFLSGRKKQLIKRLEIRMRKASKEQSFEEAARLRNQIAALQRIQDIALLNKSFVEEESRDIEVSAFMVSRIEGYDISNLGKTGIVGSMVVFGLGGSIPSEYRKFKIRTLAGQSDVDALEEMIVRRLRHDEWPLPNLFLIDGGKPQVNRVKKILKELNVDIPVVGIAKGPTRKKNEFILGTKQRDVVSWIYKHTKLLIRVRDEAHRFAISYQKQLRKIK